LNIRVYKFHASGFVVAMGSTLPTTACLGLFSFDFYKERSTKLILMSVLGPTAEALFIACPKKSTQKKRPPAFRQFPALLAFVEGFSKGLPSPCEKRATSLPRPFGQFSTKAAMLGRYVRDLKACLRQFVRFAAFFD
jgi:hypothetical protein